MGLRNPFIAGLFIASLFATALAWSGISVADEYRADEFLGLDLSKAVLSPKPLGPAASFQPGPLDMTVDRESNRAHAMAEPVAGPEFKSESRSESRSVSRSVSRPVVHAIRPVHAAAQPPRLMARTKIAAHRSNPMDAQASDAHIQVWPCRSGGICNWKR
jgi:hypothetical protein